MWDEQTRREQDKRRKHDPLNQRLQRHTELHAKLIDAVLAHLNRPGPRLEHTRRKKEIIGYYLIQCSQVLLVTGLQEDLPNLLNQSVEPGHESADGQSPLEGLLEKCRDLLDNLYESLGFYETTLDKTLKKSTNSSAEFQQFLLRYLSRVHWLTDSCSHALKLWNEGRVEEFRAYILTAAQEFYDPTSVQRVHEHLVTFSDWLPEGTAKSDKSKFQEAIRDYISPHRKKTKCSNISQEQPEGTDRCGETEESNSPDREKPEHD